MNCLVKLSIEGAIYLNQEELSISLSKAASHEIRNKYLELWFNQGKFWIEKEMLHSKLFDELDIESYENFVSQYISFCRKLHRIKWDFSSYKMFSEFMDDNEINYYFYVLLNKTKYIIPFYWFNSELNHNDYFIFKYLKSHQQRSFEGSFVEIDREKLKKIFGVAATEGAIQKFKDIGILSEKGIKNRHKIYFILNSKQIKEKLGENKENVFINYNI